MPGLDLVAEISYSNFSLPTPGRTLYRDEVVEINMIQTGQALYFIEEPFAQAVSDLSLITPRVHATFSHVVVPEPSTFLSFGLLGLGTLRRRKRRTIRDPS